MNRICRGFFILLFAVMACLQTSPIAKAQGLEIWHDLAELAVVETDHEAYLASSVCPSGCEYDRHSSEDWRYLYKVGDLGFILDEKGPGVLTRLWFTMGDGRSIPLDSGIDLFIEIDGEVVVDQVLPEVFEEGFRPGQESLVLDRSQSSGGNLSWIPLAYENRVRVGLRGADEAKIWFQVGGLHLGSAFDSEVWKNSGPGLVDLFQKNEGDPWSAAGGTLGPLLHRVEMLFPGQSHDFDFSGPDYLTLFTVETPAENLSQLYLNMTFDGHQTIAIDARQFFGLPEEHRVPDRRLMVRSEGDRHRSFLPMPFWEEARLRITNRGDRPVSLKTSIRRKGRAPIEGSGYLRIQEFSRAEPVSEPLTWVELEGRGRWVGISTRLGAPQRRMEFLEGDESVWIDRLSSRPPNLLGTGTEDFFNGGFYFDAGDFSLALHGSPWHQRLKRQASTEAYRWLLLDSVFFRSSLRVELENGRLGQLPMWGRSVAYLYWLP